MLLWYLKKKCMWIINTPHTYNYSLQLYKTFVPYHSPYTLIPIDISSTIFICIFNSLLSLLLLLLLYEGDSSYQPPSAV